LRSSLTASGVAPILRAIAWPDGSDHVMPRSRLRCGSDVGGVDDLVRPHLAVAEVEGRLPADEAPRRAGVAAQVDRVALALTGGVEVMPKKAAPLSPATFARYDGRTMLWPKR
jgi:hypothetical protein